MNAVLQEKSILLKRESIRFGPNLPLRDSHRKNLLTATIESGHKRINFLFPCVP
jgi:hypothetical protein